MDKRGYGIFGPGGPFWISGGISAAAAVVFKEKAAELAQLYREVYGHASQKISKAATLEYILLGRRVTRGRLEALRRKA